MDLLIWIGAAISLVGVVALGWCVVLAARARRAGLQDAEMRAALQRALVINMAALAISAIGLMMVVVGVILS